MSSAFFQVFACPTCGKLLKRSSLLSGNTVGARMYSDGKLESPRMPVRPDFTRCSGCSTYLWLADIPEVGTYTKWDEQIPAPWQDADVAQFLSMDEYFDALETLSSPEEQLFIRRSIWWAYNDRIREDRGAVVVWSSEKIKSDEEKLFTQPGDEERWTENSRQFIKLLDNTDQTQQIMKAELHRNLGEFAKCKALIEVINDPTMEWLQTKFIEACNRNDRWLIEIG